MEPQQLFKVIFNFFQHCVVNTSWTNLEPDPVSQAVVINRSITPFSRAQVDNNDDSVIGFFTPLPTLKLLAHNQCSVFQRGPNAGE